jgi:hypothetical protein
MPHFFLHIRDRDGLTADPEGTGLPDLEAARTDALAAAREILAEPIAKDGKTGTRASRSSTRPGGFRSQCRSGPP